MNYTQSLHYLDSFINFERLMQRPQNRFMNLDRMKHVLKRLGNPDQAFESVLIAGTKGKGSTGFYLESLLKKHGVFVGFYCSPHLETPRERIRLSGSMISKQKWVTGIRELKSHLRGIRMPQALGELTYFEFMTLLAIWTFKKEGVRVGVFEVGMGGRLDATNSLKQKLSILTPIDYDHQEFLGNTLAKIAFEKASIIKEKGAVVVADQKLEASRVIDRFVNRQKAQKWPLSRIKNFRIGLRGEHQKKNAEVALTAFEVLQKLLSIPGDLERNQEALAQERWPGRMELCRRKGDFLLDVAHNPTSIGVLCQYLQKDYPRTEFVTLFNASQDKDVEGMLETLSFISKEIILSAVPQTRVFELEALIPVASRYFRDVYVVQSIQEGLLLAEEKMNTTKECSMGLVTGSFFVVGEARKHLKKGFLK